MAVMVRSATGHAPGREVLRQPRSRSHCRVMAERTAAVAAAAMFACLCAAPAGAQNVRITKLGDVDFSTIANLAVDSSRSQSVCAFSNSATRGYNIRASGSGTAGAFTLADGAQTLSYEVQWNAGSGQPSGTSLSPNVALTGLVSSATQQQCNSGPSTSASLIVLLRSAALGGATAGTYNGTLTIVLAPE